MSDTIQTQSRPITIYPSKWKLLLWILFAMLVMACSEQETPDPYQRTLTLTTAPAGDVKLGERASFVVAAQDFATERQEVAVAFDESRAEVWVNGTQVNSGHYIPMSVDGSSISIEVNALVEGEIILDLRVKDGQQTVTQKLSFTAAKKVYLITLENVPDMYPGWRRSIDMTVVDPERPELVTVDYLMSAKVIKGRGVVHILGDMVWNDTLPDFEPTTSPVLNSRWAIMYTGFEVGENQIEFTLQDSEGDVYHSVSSILIKPSEFAIDTLHRTPSTVIDRHKSFMLHCMIDDGGNYSNEFSARCYFTKGAGEIATGSAILSEEEDALTAINRSQTFSLWPDTEGAVEAVIEIHDKYGTVHSVPVAVTVNGNDYNIELNVKQELSAYSIEPFKFSLTGSVDTLNDYRLTAEIVEGDAKAVTMTLNTQDILGAGAQKVMPNETMYVTFRAAGTYRMRLLFEDKWSDPKEQLLTFTVKENPLVATFTATEHTAVLGGAKDYAQWQGTLFVATGKEDDTFRDATVKYTLTGGEGVMKLNNVELVSGKASVINDRAEALNFYYTPSTVGRHTLTFLFSLADGRQAQQTVTVDVSYSPISLNLACPSGVLYEGEAREISLLASQPGYNDGMQYKFEFAQGTGKITGADGTELVAGATYPLTQGVAQRMNYTAEGYIGPVEIRYTVLGGGSVQQSARFTVEQGLSMSMNMPSSVMMGNTANLTVTANKAGSYTGGFKVMYEVLQPYPSYVGEGSVDGLTAGVASPMTGNSQTFVFRPTMPGTMQLRVTVTDDAGVSVSRTVTVKVALQPLAVNPPAIDAVRGDDITVDLTIPDSNPAGEYQLSYVITWKADSDETLTNAAGGIGDPYFESEVMQWTQGMVKTLTPGSYKFNFTFLSQSASRYLRFTLIAPNGEVAVTKVKITNLDY